jgi:PAS domain S-box-containing protein
MSDAALLPANDHDQQNRNLFNPPENQGIFTAILQTSLQPLPLEEQLNLSLRHILSIETLRFLAAGAIFLLDERDNVLKLTAQHRLPEGYPEACREVPVGTCFCGQAALTAKPVHARHDNSGTLDRGGIAPHGHYCIPMLSGERLLGVIGFHTTAQDQQKKGQEEDLWAISYVIAGMIERKRVEEAQQRTISRLKNEQKFNSSILQSLNSGLMVLDPSGAILTCNAKGEAILGRSADSLVGLPLAEVLGETEAAGILQLVFGGNRESVRERIEVSLACRQGKKRTLGVKVTPHEDGEGARVGIILSFIDITDLKQARLEMEKMNRLSTMAEIASAVAHEVRNPLAGIKTMSQAIEENMAESDANREYITRIIRQVDRLNQLLNEFFTYARPGKPKKILTSIADIINETRPLITSRLKKYQIVIRETYEARLPHICADPNQIQQVFLNLILNSIDALAGPGRIEIAARRFTPELKAGCARLFPALQNDRPAVMVTFTDNGPGMAAHVADKAFDPFFSTKAKGSGLGLAIVFRILQENNAAISIDRSLPEGVTFIMLFEACP